MDARRREGGMRGGAEGCAEGWRSARSDGGMCGRLEGCAEGQPHRPPPRRRTRRSAGGGPGGWGRGGTGNSHAVRGQTLLSADGSLQPAPEIAPGGATRAPLLERGRGSPSAAPPGRRLGPARCCPRCCRRGGSRHRSPAPGSQPGPTPAHTPRPPLQPEHRYFSCPCSFPGPGAAPGGRLSLSPCVHHLARWQVPRAGPGW